MRYVLAAVATTGLFATGSAYSQEPSAASSAPPIAQVRDILDDVLVNYPETRLRNVQFVSTGFAGSPKSIRGFCGEMNTQNRMGGYTGWSPFFVSPDPVANGAPDRLYVAGMRSTMDDYSPGFSAQIVGTFCGASKERLSPEDFSEKLAFEDE